MPHSAQMENLFSKIQLLVACMLSWALWMKEGALQVSTIVSSICVGLQGVTTKFVGVAPIITFKDATKKKWW